jgi:hypothetical protein
MTTNNDEFTAMAIDLLDEIESSMKQRLEDGEPYDDNFRNMTEVNRAIVIALRGVKAADNGEYSSAMQSFSSAESELETVEQEEYEARVNGWF